MVVRINDSLFVRAYDVTTGTKVWEKPIGAGRSVAAIKVCGNQVILAGSSLVSIGNPEDNNFTNDFFCASTRGDQRHFIVGAQPPETGR